MVSMLGTYALRPQVALALVHKREASAASPPHHLSAPLHQFSAPLSQSSTPLRQSSPSSPVVVAGPQPASGRFLGTFVVTCYDLTGTTASGSQAGPGSVAVDPSVIPLGTRIVVGGAGTFVADDTGGAIVGHRLDIWEGTAADCANWGVQSQPVWLAG
jgi:3D (Asp-Asp-Asp) domain-containing protein